MVLAGTSSVGCCPRCAAPWVDEQTPTCQCEGNDASGRPVVLDPFAGSGTTGLVALSEGCDFIGIDLQEDYLAEAVATIRGESIPAEDDPEDGVLDLFGE
jgi:hypothetical protein